jgi:hypothetical protein
MGIAPHEHQQMYAAQDDTAFLVSSFDDDALQPTVLRQLREYTSRMDASSLDGSERSMSSRQIQIFPPSGAMPSSHSSEKGHPATPCVPNQKRKLVDSGDFSL